MEATISPETISPLNKCDEKSGMDEEKRAALRAAALEFGTIQHTYRIPHGFMGYGGSGAWD